MTEQTIIQYLMGKYLLELNCARIINLLALINILMNFPAIHNVWLSRSTITQRPVASLMLSTKTQTFLSNVVVMIR